MLGAGLHVFAVWPWILSNCDRTGRVEINPRLLAFTLGTDEGRIEDALGYLMAPDPHSRTDEAGGVRLERVGEFAYQIVNYAKYREIKSAEDRRAYDRERKRARKDAEQSGKMRNKVERSGRSANSVHADADVDVDVEVISESTVAAKAAPARSDVDFIVEHFCKCYRTVKPGSRTDTLGPRARKVIREGLKRWDVLTIQTAITRGAERAARSGGNDAKYFRASTIFRNEANLERLIESAEDSSPSRALEDAAAAFFGGRFDD